ncbi:hypothetical protein HanRHA438_Chr14g0668571 [Helianthus annuus]|nr:hypothetical protein HanRHA438_Chr14g0668571 [Helianthus annuus]
MAALPSPLKGIIFLLKKKKKEKMLIGCYKHGPTDPPPRTHSPLRCLLPDSSPRTTFPHRWRRCSRAVNGVTDPPSCWCPAHP